MKKLLAISFFLFGCMLYSIPCFSQGNSVPLEIIDESEIGDFGTKGPSYPSLLLYQNGDVLTFNACDSNYMLVLLDADKNIDYTILVPAGTAQIVLPSSLSGFYELRLYADTYYYKGFISLL